MATTVDFVHAYTAVNNSGIILLGQRKRRCRALEKSLEGLKDIDSTEYNQNKNEDDYSEAKSKGYYLG